MVRQPGTAAGRSAPSHRAASLALVGLLSLALVAGCDRSGSDPKGKGADGKGGDGKSAGGSLTIKGSDTMTVLVGKWAEEYAKAVTGATSPAVTGGGSGTGITAMIGGTADLCMSSRQVKKDEVAKGKAKGVEFKEHAVGLDGIAIVVHPSNPVKELSVEQLAGIFTGKITNWKDVGGPDKPIQAMSRESTSGTYEFFKEHVMSKKDFAAEVRLLNSNAAIVQEITGSETALGYVGFAFMGNPGVKAVPVKAAADKPAVAPSVATVKDKTYPIARELYIYSNGEPAGAAKAFLDYALSKAGQKVLADEGYIPLH